MWTAKKWNSWPRNGNVIKMNGCPTIFHKSHGARARFSIFISGYELVVKIKFKNLFLSHDFDWDPSICYWLFETFK